MTIASNSSPHLHGLRVTSKVERPRIREATPYCVAARITPGIFSNQRISKLGPRATAIAHLFLSFDGHQYPSQTPWPQNVLWATPCIRPTTLDAQSITHVRHTTRSHKGVVQ